MLTNFTNLGICHCPDFNIPKQVHIVVTSICLLFTLFVKKVFGSFNCSVLPLRRKDNQHTPKLQAHFGFSPRKFGAVKSGPFIYFTTNQTNH